MNISKNRHGLLKQRSWTDDAIDTQNKMITTKAFCESLPLTLQSWALREKDSVHTKGIVLVRNGPGTREKNNNCNFFVKLYRLKLQSWSWLKKTKQQQPDLWTNFVRRGVMCAALLKRFTTRRKNDQSCIMRAICRAAWCLSDLIIWRALLLSRWWGSCWCDFHDDAFFPSSSSSSTLSPFCSTTVTETNKTCV